MTAMVKRLRRENLIGYILIGIFIAGLIFLVYWTVAGKWEEKRVPGIEKSKGESQNPAHDDLSLYSYADQYTFAAASRHSSIGPSCRLRFIASESI